MAIRKRTAQRRAWERAYRLKTKRNEYEKSYQKAPKAKTYRKCRSKKLIEALSDSYVIGLIRQGTCLARADIPPNMIEAKRLLITAQRLFKAKGERT